MYQRLTFNLSGTGHSRTLRGRTYDVFPAVMMLEGVWSGSQGDIFYPAKELAKSCPAWNNKPIVRYHPKDTAGNLTTAASEAVMERDTLGFVLNARWEDDKQKAEAWFDREHTNAADPTILSRLKGGQPVELSTGLYFDGIPVRNNRTFRGTAYALTAKNHRPDHLAVLPTGTGACSIKDGAGIGVNAKNGVAPDAPPIGNVQELKDAIRGFRGAANKKAAKKHITERAAALGATAFLPKAWRPIINARTAAGEASHNDVTMYLNDALAERFGKPGKSWYGYVADVFDNTVVFRDADHVANLDNGGPSSLWQVGYDRTEKGVKLHAGAPVRVERDTIYRPTANAANDGGAEPPTEEAPAMALTKEQKAALVTTIIGNSASKWTEVDRPALEGLDEAILTKWAAPATVSANSGGTVTPPANTTAPANRGPVSVDAFIGSAPPELQSMLQDMVLTANQQRKQLIDVIVAHPANTFPREVLEKTPTPNLKGIAALAAAQTGPPVGNYAPIVGDGANPVLTGNFAGAAGAVPGNYAMNGYGHQAPLEGNGNTIDTPAMTFENPLAARR